MSNFQFKIKIFQIGYFLTTRGDKYKKLQLVFDMYDTNGNGYLDRSELREALNAMFKLYAKSSQNIENILHEWFDGLDKNEDGSISKSKICKDKF